MKLIGIMSLDADIDAVHGIFEQHNVEMFSELSIKGHSRDTLKLYGWWPTAGNETMYSVLCFAVIDKMRADDIMAELRRRSEDNLSEHPIRAMQVDVERFV